MSALPANFYAPERLRRVARFPGLRALTWTDDVLYASRGYDLLRTRISPGGIPSDNQRWEPVGSFHPAFWRHWTARTNLTSRLLRDGFHALAVLPSDGHRGCRSRRRSLLSPRTRAEFRRNSQNHPRHAPAAHHRCSRSGTIFWGEYFDNAARDEVHIYASTDAGATWNVAYTFPKGAIRHVHNIVYDPWDNCLWVLTGDYGDECRILRATCDFRPGSKPCSRAISRPVPSRSSPPKTASIFPPTRRSNRTTSTVSIATESYRNSPSSAVRPSTDAASARDVFFSTMVEPSRSES